MKDQENPKGSYKKKKKEAEYCNKIMKKKSKYSSVRLNS